MTTVAAFAILALFLILCVGFYLDIHTQIERQRQRDSDLHWLYQQAIAEAAEPRTVLALDASLEEIEIDFSQARGWSANDVMHTLAQIETL